MTKYLQDYSFVLKHRKRVENQVANALSCRIPLLSIMYFKIIGFERLKEDYETRPDFREVYLALLSGLPDITIGFRLYDRYLFQANQFCIPMTSVRDFIM